jgi:hypothetical protein
MVDFIYIPPDREAEPLALNSTMGVKFANRIVILDPWGFALMFKTRWQRILFRLRHPVAYSKRWFVSMYRRVKYIFVKPKMYTCRKWMSKEEALKLFPKDKQ